MSSDIYVPATFAFANGERFPIIAARLDPEGNVHVVTGPEAGPVAEDIVMALVTAIAVDWNSDQPTVLEMLGGAYPRGLFGHGPVAGGATPNEVQNQPNMLAEHLVSEWGLPTEVGSLGACGSVWVVRFADPDGSALIPVDAVDYADVVSLGNGSDVQHWNMLGALGITLDPFDAFTAQTGVDVLTLDGGPGDADALDALGAFLATLGVGDVDPEDDPAESALPIHRLVDGVDAATGARVFAVDAEWDGHYSGE